MELASLVGWVCFVLILAKSLILGGARLKLSSGFNSEKIIKKFNSGKKLWKQ